MFSRILSILVVGSLVQASNGLQLPEQYINLPLIKGRVENGCLDYDLIRYLNLSADTSPEMVMGQFKRFIKVSDRKSSNDFRAAKNFLELDDGRGNCSIELEQEFLIKYQAYKTTTRTEAYPEVMLNFLDHYGRRKFPACAREAIADIKHDIAHLRKFYERPVKFFRLALSLNRWASASKFYNELRQFKPLEFEINVNKLAPICERWTPNEPAAERIKREFDMTCGIVMNLNRKAMNILNLANYFDPKGKYFEKNLRIGAMNEIKRACIEVEENDTLLEHLKKLCKPKHDSMGPRGLGP